MNRLKIAIIGSGIASSCLAYALCQCSNLEVKIFEASNAFREDGAAIGLGSNAQEALKLISPIRESLGKAGGVRMQPSVRLIMVSS